MILPNVPDDKHPRFCPYCMGELKPDEVSNDWMNDVYNDESMWYTEGFPGFPSIIAHEYWRLREMFRARQPYGVYFQIRDLAETVLKFEVLSVCAWADAAEIQDYQKQVGCLITTRGMSLGAWYEVARRIQAFFKNPVGGQALPTVFSAALDGIIQEYGDGSRYVREHENAQSILNWRNEKIGHGALGFSEDDAFRKDIRTMIVYFKALFEMCPKKSSLTVGEALTRQKLWLNNRALMGYESARGLNEADGALRICIDEDNVDFPVAPYMVYDDGSIFFFDNQKSPDRTQQQCYMNGYRKNADIPFFTQLLRMNTSANLESDIAAQTRIRGEDDLLNRLSVAPKYIKPGHLVDWLKGRLDEYERGVFCLRMPRGSGKSTFAEKLNCLYEKPTRLAEDVDVRTYHISRAQMINARDFARHIEEQWRHDYENRTEWTAYTQISEFMTSGMNPAEALAHFLNDCLVFTRQVRRKNRILMVIDGLDEITEDTLWDYLPSPEQLDAGVYVLLTSRDPDKEALPEKVDAALSNIKATETLTVDVEGEGNIAFLNHYVREHIDRDKRERMRSNAIDALLRHGEYRVLYVGLLCKLVNADMPIDELPSADRLVEKYLGILSASYGEKETLRLRELLSVLCSIGAEEPLSMRELAGLLNNGTLSLGLLGMMQDIAPLLKAQRGYQAGGRWYAGENRYEPANPELAEALKEQIPEWKNIAQELLEDACNTAEAEESEGKPCDGKTNTALLVLAHAKVCGGYSTRGESVEERMDVISEFIGQFHEDSHIRVLERIIAAENSVLEVFKMLDAEGQLHDRHKIVKVYWAASYVYVKLTRYNEALEACDQLIAILEAMDAVQQLPNRTDLAESYIKKAYVLYCLTRYEESLVLYDKAAEILETQYAVARVYDRNSLASRSLSNLYMNKAAAMNSLRRFDEALELLMRAKEIAEALDAAGKLSDRSLLGTIYNDTASTLDDLSRFDEALEYYNRVFEIQEALDEAGKLFDRSELAHSYSNMAITLRKLKRYDEAVEKYSHAKAILESLDDNGQLQDRGMLASVYMNMAVSLEKLNRCDEALIMYDLVRIIWEDLDANGQLYNRIHLASVYFNMAGSLLTLNRHSEALALLGQARAVWEALDAAGQVYDHNLLATACVYMAGILNSQGRKEAALAMFERAQKIMEALYAEGQLYDNNALIAIYVTIAAIRDGTEKSSNIVEQARQCAILASTEDEKNDFSEALKHYARARVVLEVQDAEGELKNRGLLATVCMNMANVLAKLSRFDEALELYQRARSIWEEMVSAGGLDVNDDLAGVCRNMAFSLGRLSRFDEALEMLEHAQTILEAQDAAGKLHDRSDLAKVYANLAFTLNDLNRHEEALAMNKRALTVWEAMENAGQKYDQNEHANVCLNTSGVLIALGRNEEALEMAGRARTIRETLDADGELQDRNELANVYLRIGIILRNLDRCDEALEMLEKTIDIQEALDETGELRDRNELARTYFLAGILYQDQGSFSEALSAYMTTSEILNELDENGLEYDHDLLDFAADNGKELMRFLAMNGAFSSETDGEEIDWDHVEFLFPGQSMEGLLDPTEEQDDDSESKEDKSMRD